jgi:hypothetical protein
VFHFSIHIHTLAATVQFFKAGQPSVDVVFTGHKKGASGTPKNTVLQDFPFYSCTKIGVRSTIWKKVVNLLLVHWSCGG